MVMLEDGRIRIQVYEDDPDRAMDLLYACNQLELELLKLIAKKNGSKF